MVAGSVGFGVMTIGVFLLAMMLKTPLLLGLLPIWLVVAAGATMVERWTMRCVGLGALMGAVVVWTVGWGVGICVMVVG
jgi:hypothetical protein